MKKIIFLFSILILTMVLSSCTENARTRHWGGSMTYDLPAGQQLMMVTWKESDLWILTKDMDENHTPQTYSLKESSSLGVWEGEIKIKEYKSAGTKKTSVIIPTDTNPTIQFNQIVLKGLSESTKIMSQGQPENLQNAK